jgi:hypothetical protein
LAKTSAFEKIRNHVDRDEIISKLSIGITPKDINEWLSHKYAEANEKKLIISLKDLISFKDNYLDIYNDIKADFAAAKNALVSGTSDSLELSVQNNTDYKNLVIKTVSQEHDLKEQAGRLVTAIETRLAQIYDHIQEDPRNINTKVDYVLIKYAEVLGGLLEKAYKIIEGGPDQIIQHNVNIQQNIDINRSVFYEAIRETLQEIDIETSMLFMEKFTEKFNRLQDPSQIKIQPVQQRLAEVQILHETMTKKLTD